MSEHEQDTIRAQVERFVGVRNGPYKSYNSVNRAQIWQWCAAMDDQNRRYLPEQGPAVAPPAMMQTWTMRDCHFNYAPGSTSAHPFEVLSVLATLGFAANVAVSYDLRFKHELRDGDRAEHYTTIADITSRKKTALGEGYFVTERAEYLDQRGDTFAEALITYFAYKPVERTEADNTATNTHTPPATTVCQHDEHGQQAESINALRNDGPPPAHVNAGDALPALTLPISATLIVAGAIASQDFTEVHHDYHAARAAGMPNIFMNILTTCGLSARYITDWSGPEARLLSLAFRLFAPNTPGDSMQFSGEVASSESNADGRVIAVEFKGANSLGLHVAGRAGVLLPTTAG